MQRRSPRASIATLVLAALAWSSLASAQGPAPDDKATEEARTRFTRGVELYKEGDYRAAIIEFRRAYSLAPNYHVLYNIGQAEQEVQNYSAALDAYERYLAEGKDEIPQDRRDAVKVEIDKLNGRVAYITIKANVAGASIEVDESNAGVTPLDTPLRVSAGHRKVTLTKGGYLPQTRDLDLAGRDKKDVVFKLSSLYQASQPPPPAPAPKPKESHGPGTGFWVGISVTGALAVGAGVVGVFALQAKSDHDQKLGTLGVTQTELDSSRSKVKNLALATDILAGSALLVGVGTVVFLRGSSGQEAAVSVGPRGASVLGRF